MDTQQKIDAVLEMLEHGDWESWYSDAVRRGPSFEEAFFAYLFELEGYQVEREYVVGKYPLDFAVPSLKLGIELDCPGTRKRGGRDSKRNKANAKEEFFDSIGWTIHRINWVKKPFENTKRDKNIFRTRTTIETVLSLLEEIGCPKKEEVS